MKTNEPEFLGEKMTDFERNLFLKRAIIDLKEEISKKDFTIGEMRSEIDELKHTIENKSFEAVYSTLTHSQKINFKRKLREDLEGNQVNQINILSAAMVKRNKRIEELEKELEKQSK